MNTKRYVIENPHPYFIGIKDTRAPSGGAFVKYWNDSGRKNRSAANKLLKELNNEPKEATKPILDSQI